MADEHCGFLQEYVTGKSCNTPSPQSLYFLRPISTHGSHPIEERYGTKEIWAEN